MRGGALRIDAKHLDAARLKGAPAVAKFAQLPCAARRVVDGVKHQHDVAAL